METFDSSSASPSPAVAEAGEDAAPAPAGGMTPEGEAAHWDAVLLAAASQARHVTRTYDKFVKLFKEGQFGRLPDEVQGFEHPLSKGSSANETFSHVTTLLAVLMSNDPAFEVEPTGAQPPQVFGMLAPMLGLRPEDVSRIFADTNEELLDHGYRAGGMAKHDVATVFGMLVKGLGWSKVSFDPETGRSRVDCLNREEVYVDPFARYDLAQAQYVVHTCAMPLPSAKAFFRARGADPMLVANLKANWSSGEDESPVGQERRAMNPDAGGKRNLYRFHEIWTKDGLLDGSGQKMVLYKAWDKKGPEWIHRAGWPFAMPAGEFPFEPLMQNSQYIQLADAFPDLYVVEGLREAYEEMVDYFRKHTLRSIARKILIDDSLASEADDILDFMLSASNLDARVVKNTGQKELKDLVHVVSMATNEKPEVELAEYVLNTRQRIAGMDELQRGAKTGQMTAQEAAIRDEWAKTRTGRWMKLIDGWQGALARKRSHVDRQLMDPQKVQRIASHPLAGLFWQVYAGDPDDLECEYSIGIAAGSTGERHKQQKISRLREAMNDGMGLNQAYGGPVVDLLTMWLEVQETNGMRRPERYLGPLGMQLRQQGNMMPGMMPMAPGPAMPGAPVAAEPIPPAGPEQAGPAIPGQAPNVIPMQGAA